LKYKLSFNLFEQRLQNLRRFTNRKLQDSDSVVDVTELDNEDALDSAPKFRKSASEQAIDNLGLKGGSKLWFGKDYTNFIVKDFVDLDLPFQDLVDRNTTPRMPWHDLSCIVTGAAARDVARHFIERWNFTKFEKAKFHDTYPWLIPKSYANVNQIKPPKYLLRSNPVSCQVVTHFS
jgi:phospholipase D1/2